MSEHKIKTLDQIKGRLIVSCQALAEEPLHSSFIMGRMAIAALRGGGAGIRANTPEDIVEIKKNVDLPIIGIYKKVYPGEPVFITPTMSEIDALTACGCEIIATDATARRRPDGKDLTTFFTEVRSKYPDQLFMADVSTLEEGIKAYELGFDLIGTTLCGYTDYTKGTALPNYELIRSFKKQIDAPIIAEGGIHYPEQLKEVFEAGAFSAVVGGAITRPMEITARFVAAIDQT